jgi:hypothetical protein
MVKLQQTGQPARNEREAVVAHSQPANELSERGGHRGQVLESSFYTKASLHPMATAGFFVVAGLAAVALCWPRAPRRWRRQVPSVWRIPTWLA